MALRHADNGDFYATAQIPLVWDADGGAGNTVITAAAARFGTTGIHMTNGGFVSKFLDNQASWVVGAAVKVGARNTANAVIQLLDGGTTQLTLTIGTMGQLSVINGSGVTLGTTALGLITPNIWYYIELKATINNSTGSYDARINGVSVLSASGADTQNSANAYANVVKLANEATAAEFTDIYICDTTGSAPHNDFLGDVRIQTILPSGAGATTQWTPSTGSNYQNVDDVTPDGDTTYNSSATLNQIDTYAYSNVTPTTGTVYGVVVAPYAHKDDAGTRSIAVVVRHSGTDYVGTTRALSASYQYHPQIYTQNPGTSAAWTIAEVNAAEFGIKLVG